MTKQPVEVFSGTTVDEDTVFTIAEICRACGVHADAVAELVEYGVLEPIGDNSARWCFSGGSLRRVTTVVRLQRDLGVNLAGAALALDLLERITALKTRLRAFEREVGS